MFWKRESKRHRTGRAVGHYVYDLFIPHEGNNHRPHVLHHKALIGYSVFLVAIKVGVVALTIALPASNVFSSAITAGNIISLTNAARSGAGIESVSWNDLLGVAAQNKANDMALHEYFAHTSPSGTTPWYWIRSAGYTYTYAGENLAVHFQEAEDVTAGWMASPTHRANILEPRFEEIGVGVSYGKYKDYPTTFVVQMFGVNEAAAVEEPEPEPVAEPEPEPVAEPEPVEEPEVAEPAPEPVPVEEPEVVVEEVQGDESKIGAPVTVTPEKNYYEIEVDVPDAESVAVQLAGETAELQKNENGTWSGGIGFNPGLIDDNGEEILLVAVNGDGEQSIEPISYIAPESEADDVFAFSADKDRGKFLGMFNVKGINDSVQIIFLFAALFLGAAVFVTMLLRVERKHHSMLVHVLSVLILVLILAVI